MFKSRTIKITIGIIAVAICATIILYTCRGVILRHIATRRIARMEQQIGLHVSYSELEMKGIRTFSLRGLSMVPENRDTLLTLRSLDIGVDFWQLLWGTIHINKVRLDGLKINLIKRDSLANYDFLFLAVRNDEDASTKPSLKENAQEGYNKRVNTVLNLLFGLLPESGEITGTCIREQKDHNYVFFSIPRFNIDHHRFVTHLSITEDSIVQQWRVDGEINSSERRLSVHIQSPKIQIPYIRRRFGAEVQLDSLSLLFSQESKDSKQTCLNGQSDMYGLQIYHRRLSPDKVNLNHGKLDFHLICASRNIEMDSTSTIQFNRLTFHPYIRIERTETNNPSIPKWHITTSIRKPWFPAEELFGSLPAGLFGNLEGIRVSGELAYHFLLDVDFTRLDSLKLESELQEKNFRIIDYGKTDLRKMSGEFEYTAYDNGIPVRTFPIGPSWEHFTPIDSIPELLQMSVMQSEDGAFFYHRGFLPDAMREALIYDLETRRFARGGSTISMQLVKNVFLNRNKNIARKLEEALIVWLIENKRLTPKERMYEVYLNIAEWGPLIYGIREAAAYYFDKRPSQLSIEECIFLASIIPKPKHFKSSFTEEGKLKESQAGYFRLIGERLVKKGVISETQAAGIDIENVVLKGKAGELFLPTDTIAQ